MVHKFHRDADPNDQIVREVDREFPCNTQRQRRSQREERGENQTWKTKRDAMANAMWQDYQAWGVS